MKGPARKEPTPPPEPPTIFSFSEKFHDMNLKRHTIRLGNCFEGWLETTRREDEQFTDEQLVATLNGSGTDFRKARPAFWYMVERGTLEQSLNVFNEVLSNPPENIKNGENNLFIRPDIALDVADLILKRDVVRDGKQALTAQEEGAFQALFTNMLSAYKSGSSAFAERRQVNWYESRVASSLRNLYNNHSELLYGLGGKPFLEIMSEVKSIEAFKELARACKRLSPKEAAISLAMSIRLPELVKANVSEEYWRDSVQEEFRSAVNSLVIALLDRRGELSDEDKKAVIIFLRLTEPVLKPWGAYEYALVMTDFYGKFPEFKEATLSRNPVAEEIDLPAIKKGLVENPLTDPFWEDLKAKPPHKSRKN